MTKILITGFRDGPFTDRLTLEANVNDSSLYAVWKAYRSMGAQVDLRRVVPGEDVRGYDAIFVGMADPRAYGTRPALGALWCLAMEHHGGPPCVAFFTHWKVKEVFGGLRWLAKDQRRLFDGFIRYDRVPEARPYEGVLRDELDRLNSGDWPDTAINAWDWADPREMAVGYKAPFHAFDLLYDPTPLMWSPKTVSLTGRQRRWVMGTHEDHAKWIRQTTEDWPIEHYGLPRSRSELGYLPKAQLLERHSECWGALVPPYGTSGDGYWRARIMHAADRMCVAAGSPKELEPFGGAYTHSVADVEAMSDDDLGSLCQQQAQDFAFHKWSDERLRTRLKNHLDLLLTRKRMWGSKLELREPTTERTLF